MALSRSWWAITPRGMAAIAFGVLTFVLPVVTLAALVLLFGAYALVEGVFNLAARGTRGGQPWWALLLEGLVSIAAGAITFALPGLTAVVLLWVIAAWAVVTGVLEIAAAGRLRKRLANEWWLGLSGVLSLVFGGLLMVAPAADALAVVLWIGAYAIVFGALLVGLGFRLRGGRVEASGREEGGQEEDRRREAAGGPEEDEDPVRLPRAA